LSPFAPGAAETKKVVGALARLNVDAAPFDASTLVPFDLAAPPLPATTLYAVPGVTVNVLDAKAPPPPPLRPPVFAPPPPPPVADTVILVTPGGTIKVYAVVLVVPIPGYIAVCVCAISTPPTPNTRNRIDPKLKSCL
jgi:hypothetical protein